MLYCFALWLHLHFQAPSCKSVLPKRRQVALAGAEAEVEGAASAEVDVSSYIVSYSMEAGERHSLRSCTRSEACSCMHSYVHALYCECTHAHVHAQCINDVPFLLNLASWVFLCLHVCLASVVHKIVLWQIHRCASCCGGYYQQGVPSIHFSKHSRNGAVLIALVSTKASS